MPQLDITFYTAQLVWLCILLGALYVTLRYGILPKLDGVIKKRENVLQTLRIRAKELEDEINYLRRSHDQKLQAERTHAREQIAAYAAKWQAEASQKEEELQTLMHTQLELLQQVLEEEKANVMHELKDKEDALIQLVVDKLKDQSPLPAHRPGKKAP